MRIEMEDKNLLLKKEAKRLLSVGGLGGSTTQNPIG
jgi:hypothetical protein